MELTYKRKRGLHWWECHQCGAKWPQRIPDQADGDYSPNPGAPALAVCPNCNDGHFPRLRLVSRAPRTWTPNGDLDERPRLDGERRTDGHLDGEWGQWAKVAAIYAHKVPFQDRADFQHHVILELATVKAKYQAKGKPLTEAGMMRVAAYELMDYWEKEKLRGRGIIVDCGNCGKAQRQKCRDGDLYVQCRKAKHIFSLYAEVIASDDGEPVELREVLADDNAVDLDAWIDARTWLAGCPRRLVQIARKLVNREAISENDRRYLNRYRKRLKQQKLPV